jgi:predicted DNA-binding transcriptional regulator YafY
VLRGSNGKLMLQLRYVTLVLFKSSVAIMSRGELVGRTWRLVRLLEHPKGRTLTELVNELGCSRRTVIRDLQGLQEAGLPIFDERDGREKRWKFVDGFKSRVPPPFTVTELLALYFARRLSRPLRDTPFYASLESVYGKISSLLPPESIALVERYDAMLSARPGPFKNYSRRQKLIQAVMDAALARKSLDITYHTFSRRVVTRRRIDPYRMFYFQGGLYIIGLDHLSEEIRIFALERIQEWSTTRVAFEVPAEFDFEDHMRSALGIFRGKETQVRIRFRPSAAPFVAEREWHETQELSTARDGSVVLAMRVADTLELKRWVLSFGSEAEVLEPDALREKIRNEAEAILAQFDRWDFAPGQLYLPMGEFLEQLSVPTELG